MFLATCHTEGCGNADQPIEIPDPTVELEGIGTVTATVVCGVCGQPITDIEQTP